ncbi:MAG: AbrB/MazE/SpoVT family DNA-binding domain-containing protein [Ruminococcus sp.]|jgi:transcriptional pleiotropic regulator of transition state genes|nr:AbrB/MazE/SpoVT family DNA-binding domain-containing protein [Ruminococcus sp.]
MAYTSYKKIDDVGRVVLPKDVREELGLRINDMIKIDVEKDTIVIRKAEESCVFCGKNGSLKHYMGKTVCANCIKQLNNT